MTDQRTVPESELDVRQLRKPDKHPTIFAAYDELTTGSSFVLVNDHDPRHLRDEFETDHAGSYEWEYLSREPRNYRIRIGKRTSTPLPRMLVDTGKLRAEDHQDPDAAGAVWKLDVRERDLDSNIVAIPPHGSIDAHAGPDLDVLVHVLAGSGTLSTELDTTVALAPGVLLWLPRRSRRSFQAGETGLRYLTVHRRRQALVLDPSARLGG
ncbi:MAG TPA: DUF2249 domain-containing protein [Nocardioides sp.]|uniref:DUF2249 domain-containing protein n=1 Tax=Nocardioides sp. TaxID=35761 RepID=UPI002F42640C